MGFGDCLIVTSIVKKAYEKTQRPVCVGDGRVYWSEVYEHNPKIVRTPTKDCVWVRNVEGNRPYIDYKKSTPERFVWNPDFRVEPGELFFAPEELHWTEDDFVYIEPNVKDGVYADNKTWGFEKWQQVVDRINVRWIQGKGKRLRGLEQCDTKSFRDACALLSRAFLFVGPDGGLRHAAAALGIPAITVWGGTAPPQTLGYGAHVNLCKTQHFCGSLKPCGHCRQALEKVSVEEVCQCVLERL